MLEDEELEREEEIGSLPENAPQEEKTYYKRYGDLRRHSQAKEAELTKRISDLEKKLTETTSSQMELPTNEEDIESWVKKYPDVAKIVMGIARKQASSATADLETKMKAIEEREHKLNMEEAQKKLMERHPDFFTEIRNDPEFHAWLDEQSDSDKDALYNNETDWRAASRVISDYKYEKGITSAKEEPKKNKTKTQSAIDDVSVRGGATPTTKQGYKFSESQIKSMSAREYDRLEEEIEDAWRKGQVLMDISNAE